MASFQQDLIVFEDDTLLIQYTFTDLQGTFDNNWGAFWAAWSYDDWTSDRSGSNNGSIPGTPGSWATPPEPDLWKYTAWTATGNGALTTTNDIEIPDGETIVKVYLDQSDFTEAAAGGQPNYLATDVKYYTELVLSPTKNDNTSVVGATGELFISSSIFSVANYRP